MVLGVNRVANRTPGKTCLPSVLAEGLEPWGQRHRVAVSSLLTEAEWVFRIVRDELKIRPAWHQKEDRVRSCMLVCLLAYAIWKTLSGRIKAAGLGDTPRTVIYEFSKINRGDVVLPAESSQGVCATGRLRFVTEPEAKQKTLFQWPGLMLPRRLRRIDRPAQMQME